MRIAFKTGATMSPDSNDTDGQFVNEDNNEKVIAELEMKIKTLKLKKDLQAGFIQFDKKEKWKTIFFILPLVILSFLPPLFVMLDRWFEVDKFAHYSRDAWCKIEFLCSSLLPPYFGWIFFILGIIAFTMIMFAPKIYGKIESFFHSPENDDQSSFILKGQLGFRKPLIIIAVIGFVAEIVTCILLKRIPGMELLLVALTLLAAIVTGETEISLRTLSTHFNTFIKKAPLYGTMVFSQVALIISLKEITSFNSQKNYLYFLPMVFAIAALIWQRKKINKLFWIFTLAIVLFSFKMSSWKFSFIGDEYSFYFLPNQLISHQTFPQIMEHFFNVKGVYDTNPYFSSLIQYVSMLFFGNDYFGWHISNYLLLAFTIPMLYDFFKSFLNERVAFLAVIPLAFSHYLINFSKIGYNNLQALFALCLILWVAAKAVQQRKHSTYFLLGLSLGVCFYTFPLGIFSIPLVGIFLLIFDLPRSKAAWLRYLLTLLGLLIILTPIFFQPDFWQNMAGRTIFFENNQSVFAFSNFLEIANRITHNILYAFLVYLYIPNESHFIVSSVVDPFLTVFLPLGFLLSIINFRKNRFLAFLVMSFVTEILILSISNPYDFPSMTRIFLLIPFFYVFAVLGLDWLVRVIAGITDQPGKIYNWTLTFVMITACILNFIQATLILHNRTERYPIQSVILRLFQQDAIANPQDTKTYLFLTDKDFGFYFFETFVDVYNVPESKAQLQHLIVESPQISETWIQRMKEQEDLIIIVPYSLETSLFTSIQPILQETGKSVCEIAEDSADIHYYQMWYSQKYPYMCEEAQSVN